MATAFRHGEICPAIGGSTAKASAAHDASARVVALPADSSTSTGSPPFPVSSRPAPGFPRRASPVRQPGRTWSPRR